MYIKIRREDPFPLCILSQSIINIFKFKPVEKFNEGYFCVNINDTYENTGLSAR